jgi:fatty-acyl-CoA synthase
MFIPLVTLRFLHRAMDVFGSKVGVISGSRSFTYAEFGERAERLADAVASLGIAPGDRVAYLSFNNHQLLEGYYGVPQARAIVMPLNVRLSVPELTEILNHSGARLLFFENDFAATAEALRRACPALTCSVNLDAPEYEQMLAAARPQRADIFSYDEMSIAELFYTSGSTGAPKGVSLSHRTLYLHAFTVGLLYKQPETMVELHTIPLFHANGWGRPQVSTMLGTTQVMSRRFDPAAVLALIEQHRATDMCLVPTMANALLNTPGRERFDVSSVRTIMIGGAASSPDLVRRLEEAFPQCQCVAGYGLTETSPVVATAFWKGIPYASDQERQARQAMTGWAVPGASVRVVDAEMRDVPRDGRTIGEVIVMGDQIMDGYFHEPEATRAVMSGAWLHTGDMAVWDEHGYLDIVDRKKEIIISGGENISSLEVERAINAHPSILECAVVAAPDETWGEVPAAVVVLKQDCVLSEAELFEFLRTRLSRYKLPRRIDFSEAALPKTGTGKIRKMQLKEKFWSGKDRRVQG